MTSGVFGGFLAFGRRKTLLLGSMRMKSGDREEDEKGTIVI